MRLRRVAWLACSVLACLSLGFGPPRLTDGDVPHRSLMPHQIALMRQMPVPEIGAQSAVLVNPSTRQILYAKNEHERLPPASLVKIVTALVALQHGRLDQEFYVRDEDLAVYSPARLQANEKFNLRDLLYMLLIPSDNAAALTIARGIGRDTRTFVGMMNRMVAEWGLKNTNFANPHGYDARDGYSSAYDMAIIAYYAMNDRTFADIVRRDRAVVSGRALETTNQLLNTYPGTLGVKTGTTDRAGECLIIMVSRPAGTVFSVVMSSSNRFIDSRLLLDYFYANFAELRIDLPANALNRYQDENLQWHELYLREPVTVLIQPWQLGTAAFYRRIDNPSPAPRPDVPVGALVATLGGQFIAEIPIYAK